MELEENTEFYLHDDQQDMAHQLYEDDAEFIARPSIKRLPPKWSLNTVLTYISKSNDDSEEFLLQKTLFLVPLATGNRASEILAMVRTSIAFEFNSNWVFIPVKPMFLYKNQRMDRAPPNISLPFFSSDGSDHPLCQVSALKVYLSRTDNHNESTALFLKKSL